MTLNFKHNLPINAVKRMAAQDVADVGNAFADKSAPHFGPTTAKEYLASFDAKRPVIVPVITADVLRIQRPFLVGNENKQAAAFGFQFKRNAAVIVDMLQNIAGNDNIALWNVCNRAADELGKVAILALRLLNRTGSKVNAYEFGIGERRAVNGEGIARRTAKINDGSGKVAGQGKALYLRFCEVAGLVFAAVLRPASRRKTVGPVIGCIDVHTAFYRSGRGMAT